MKQLTDRRQALPKYTVLDFGTEDSRGYSYTITAESGRGASCIVYQGFYENSLGEKKTVYIKECYPHSVKMTRTGDGTLSCEDAEVFEDYKKRFRDSFSLCNRIFETEGLTNTTSNYMDIHEKNGTLYTVITYRQGQELSLSTEKSLKEIIRILKSAAKVVEKLHDNGFLYLDIKPDNVFVLDEMNESIQLFDFDSMIPIDAKGDLHQYRISYSNGFAPLEQRRGRLDQIGKYTDVYGVGALLFYLVFGRVPQAPDCDPFVVYDFSQARFDPYPYRDRLFLRMGAFFKNTLAVSFEDRYPDMMPVIEDLETMEKDADLTGVFLHDSYYPVRADLIGRDAEMREICDFLDAGKGCLFIDGMGGIGKSMLVRACLDKKRDQIDTVLYLYFEDSLMATIADDGKLTVNTLARLQEESIEEYFERKLAVIRRIVEGQRVVLVIDNFEGEPGDAFAKLRDIDWQIVVISRENLEIEEERTLHIGAVPESDRNSLFERYFGRKLSSGDVDDVQKIAENIGGHTLVTEIIAKQVKCGVLSIPRAVQITENTGFSSSMKGEVAFSRDGVHRHRALLNILEIIFAEDRLDEAGRSAIQTVSIFDQPGIPKDVLYQLGGDSYGGFVEDMIRSGWIAESCGSVSVHPVIKEAIMKWDWKEQSVWDQRRIMSRIIDVPDETRGQAFQQSQIKNALPISNVRESGEYYALLWKWMTYDRRDQEALVRSVSELSEEACRYSEPISMLQGMDFICFVMEEMRDFDAAGKVLEVMHDYVYGKKDHYLIALYESTRSQFFDSVLNGAYDLHTEDAEELQDEMNAATDLAVSHMKKAVKHGYGRDSRLLLITYLLDHYVFIIRGYEGKENPKKLYNALCRIKKMLDEEKSEYEKGVYPEELRERMVHFELAVAWFHTLVTGNADGVKKAIRRLHAIESPWKTGLDHIDFDVVPCAEMLYRIGCREESEKMLMSGVAICDEYEDVAPYQRKKEELLDHIEDVRA